MITNLFDSTLKALSARWKVRHEPRGKRAYRCACQAPVFFRNSQCLNCGEPLGYEPGIGDLRSLQPGSTPGSWWPVGDDIRGEYRRCANFESPVGCNWLVPVEDPEGLCVACRLNRTIPDLRDEDNRRYWRVIETAKRRLVAQLLALDLPVVSKKQDPENGLAFDLLRSPESGPKVSTGHAKGLITINIEEADDAVRERIRTDLHEPYRTLLGHFRHEIGHYYWDRLILGSPWIEPFRALFGDERSSYSEALEANYQKGPPSDWSSRHISAYASAHPWEDWAETWAHYLHIIDSLDTAMAHGLDADDLEMDIKPFTRADLYDPEDPNAEGVVLLLNAWVELVTVLNEISRSMGHPDFYPFALPREVVRKLHFITLVIRDAPAQMRSTSAMTSTSASPS